MKCIGRKLIFLFLLFVIIAPVLTDAAFIPPQQSAAPTRIRVRLAESSPKVSIRGLDLKIFQGASLGRELPLTRQIASTASDVVEWEFRCQDDRIRAIPSHGGETLTLRSPVVLSSPAGLIRYHGRPYREEIRIHSVGSLCEVVNELDIEKYLSGLVNAEFSSQWSPEAVQAQVIAARTYALYQMRQMRERAARSGREARFDVDATVKDQVYDGYVSEDFKAARAVEKTRGMVLLAKGDTGKLEPIKAFYHSSCAGQTLLPEDVWGSRFAGFRHRVNCPFCASSAKVGWALRLSGSDVTQLVRRGARSDGAQPGWPRHWNRMMTEGELIDLRLGSQAREAGSRIEMIRTVWRWSNRYVELSLSGARFRDWIGPAKLKSTSFNVTYQRENGAPAFRFSGRGNGHGVGMCQLGAKYFGEKGYKSALILKHYYPDALLQKLW